MEKHRSYNSMRGTFTRKWIGAWNDGIAYSRSNSSEANSFGMSPTISFDCRCSSSSMVKIWQKKKEQAVRNVFFGCSGDVCRYLRKSLSEPSALPGNVPVILLLSSARTPEEHKQSKYDWENSGFWSQFLDELVGFKLTSHSQSRNCRWNGAGNLVQIKWNQ